MAVKMVCVCVLLLLLLLLLGSQETQDMSSRTNYAN